MLFPYIDGGIATAESLLQCALPLISEGQKLLEPPPTSFSVPTSSSGAFIQPNMHNSPLPDSWPEPLSTNVRYGLCSVPSRAVACMVVHWYEM